MATLQIAYDTATGRILLMHRFAADADDVDITRRRAMHHAKLPEDQVAVISVSDDELDETRRYKVDVERGSLTEEVGEGGVSFGFADLRAE